MSLSTRAGTHEKKSGRGKIEIGSLRGLIVASGRQKVRVDKKESEENG